MRAPLIFIPVLVAVTQVVAADVTKAQTPQREVQVATRRISKGSEVSCNDFETRLREERRIPKTALPGFCEIEAEMVALRDLGAGDVVRVGDIGRAPDVMAGMSVSLRVTSNGISVTTTGTALADAMIGDAVDVRLQRPTRTLKGRVSAPGVVQLLDRQS